MVREQPSSIVRIHLCFSSSTWSRCRYLDEESVLLPDQVLLFFGWILPKNASGCRKEWSFLPSWQTFDLQINVNSNTLTIDVSQMWEITSPIRGSKQFYIFAVGPGRIRITWDACKTWRFLSALPVPTQCIWTAEVGQVFVF